jgi:hypothetical protein
MKRIAMLALLLASVGCITAPPLEPLPHGPLPAAQTFPPVTPEQATETNGHQVAKALEDEINREQQQLLLTTARQDSR